MVDGEDPLAWLEAKLPALTRGRVLDLGCGEGRFLPAGAVGLDLDGERLRALMARPRRLVQADAKALPFADASFDTVYAHRMLNDTGDLDRALAEAARVLRMDGTLLVFTRARMAEGDRLDRWNGTGRLLRHFDHVTMATPEDDRAALFIARRPKR